MVYVCVGDVFVRMVEIKIPNVTELLSICGVTSMVVYVEVVPHYVFVVSHDVVVNFDDGGGGLW